MLAGDTGGESATLGQSGQLSQAPWNFTIVALPDTQFYSQSYPTIFDNQTQWIVNTVASLNTVFVTHEGDIVNTATTISQWNNANHSMSKLDGNVPWAVLPGNHDGTSVGGTIENLNNYTTYFPFSRFNGQPWYGGAYNNVNSNSFELFSGGADTYLIFHFQYHPSESVLAWANTTISNYPGRRVIVTTHDYMNVDGSRTNEGNHIWNKFVAAHADQVFLVLCGHNHGEARRTDTVNGHVVYQLLADYQDYPNGGNGWLRVLDFRPAEDRIYVETYSPYLGEYQTDADSQFTLTYDMTSSPSVYLQLTIDQDQATIATRQPLDLTVNILNHLNPALDSTLTLTITGPNNYYHYEAQMISVAADSAAEYGFTWTVPSPAGTYVMEASTIPAMLTAYDALWLSVPIEHVSLAPLPSGTYRWLDVADQAYSAYYQNSYDYGQAQVTVDFTKSGPHLQGTLTATNLKPNFAYQLKLAGEPGTISNERIGLAGRWWQEEWSGTAWINGQNLNNKGDGSSPNPNDIAYYSRRDIIDATSPTGLRYRYTGYLVFDYFITDSNGDVTLQFETGSCYHVLWKTSQRSRTVNDGPVKTVTFDPDPSQPAYETDYPISTESIFGEWERLPMGYVNLQTGVYDCQMVLTEESFHGSGGALAGNWAGALSGNITFRIED